MKLCIHGHAMTPANTYISPAGRKSCRICRKASSDRWQAGTGKPRPIVRKARTIPKYPPYGYLASEPRLKCGQCPVTTATQELMDDHRRRFHSTWDEGRLGA